MNKKILLLFTLFLIATTVVISEEDVINWETNYAEAKMAATEQNKNIFLLITAPTWCSWCIKLERGVLSDPAVIDALNSDYIPLKIVDVVDGARNPQLNFFEFPGFPTVRVYDPNGNFIEDVYSQNTSMTLKYLAKHKRM